MTKNQTDLQPTKEKQEKAPTPIRAGAPPTNARSAGIFKGL